MKKLKLKKQVISSLNETEKAKIIGGECSVYDSLRNDCETLNLRCSENCTNEDCNGPDTASCQYSTPCLGGSEIYCCSAPC